MREADVGKPKRRSPAVGRVLVAVAAVVAHGATPTLAQTSADPKLDEITIPALESLYATGRYAPTDVTRWHLARIERYEPVYNAYAKVFAEQALARAAALERGTGPRGPLWGVPVAIKASISIKGEVTHVGWWGYQLPGKELRSRADATVVQRLLDAGAILIGYTNMPDLAKSDTTVSTVGGRTGNAYDPLFSPGGSSGGSATAVAAGLAVAALGTDGGNSIRNPSSVSSLVGVLPTHGLIPISGVHAGDWLRERTGPLTRTVTDAAIMLDVLSGPDVKDPMTAEAATHRPPSYAAFLKRGTLKGKRLGVPKFILDGTPETRPNAKYWHYGTSPATRAAFMRALDELRAAGATIVIDDQILPEGFAAAALRIKAQRYHHQGIDRFLADYGPGTYKTTEEFEAVTGVAYPPEAMGGTDADHVLETDPAAEAQYHQPLREARQIYRDTLRRFNLDAFVYPALQIAPVPERVPLPADFPSDGPYSATAWANRIGVPAIVVPAGWYSSGLPFGIELSADRWEEGKLLGLAYDYEQRTRHRRAPMLRNER